MNLRKVHIEICRIWYLGKSGSFRKSVRQETLLCIYLFYMSFNVCLGETAETLKRSHMWYLFSKGRDSETVSLLSCGCGRGWATGCCIRGADYVPQLISGFILPFSLSLWIFLFYFPVTFSWYPYDAFSLTPNSIHCFNWFCAWLVRKCTWDGVLDYEAVNYTSHEALQMNQKSEIRMLIQNANPMLIRNNSAKE